MVLYMSQKYAIMYNSTLYGTVHVRAMCHNVQQYAVWHCTQDRNESQCITVHSTVLHKSQQCVITYNSKVLYILQQCATMYSSIQYGTVHITAMCHNVQQYIVWYCECYSHVSQCTTAHSMAVYMLQQCATMHNSMVLHT